MESESRETLTTGSNRLPKTEAEKESSNSDGWQAKQEVLFFRERDVASDLPPRELGVTWKNLTVEAISAEASIHENVVSQFNIPRLIQESRRKPSLRKILDSSHGCVKPGEMLLVLGRPGSGCTTLLNILANKRSGFASVAGDVFYGSMTAKEAEQYRGQIVINNEEEVFFPSLTVGQTMDFATRLKVPFTLPQGVDSPEHYRLEMRDFLLKSLDIEHTLDTKVGDAFVRGVSGGERKRVSIVECLAAKGSVFCWDNSTRGLDASTALEYAKVIRAMTDVLGLASIVTLYQAGNGIYNLFDKVLLLDGGKEIYYGPLKEARPFMEALGFICHDGANVADFLTSVTVPTEREVREELKLTFPRTAEAIRSVYEKSSGYEQMTAEYDYPKTEEARQKTDMFARAVGLEKHKSLSAKSPYSVSIAAQIWICVERQYQILWGDKATFLIKQFSTIAQALITGSLFYNAPDTSAGLLSKSGACFFALLFPTLLAMAEVTDSFTGRPVLVKHKSFGFFHPIAYCIAQIAADIPVILLSMTTFSLILYFLVGLRMAADGFFIFWAIVIATSMCMTAMFRAIGAAFATFDGASKVSGIVIAAVFMYAGYMIEKPQMHPWFVWLFWINPVAYGFDALLSNEFHHAIIPCVGVNLIPSGPEYADVAAHQACSGVGGAIPGQPFVLGDNYLKSLSYDHASLWRNFGIIWAFWALFVAITIWATSRWKSLSEGGSSLVIPRENSHIVKTQARGDEEAGPKETVGRVSEKQIEADRDGAADKVMPDVAANTAIFTWKNLSYTVKTASGDRLLLDNVHGWVEPGKLTALMGSSGAGKTTLLDVLAQRKTEGTIRGSIMVDGRPLPITFQRSAGYCEQLDVHEPYATVREALEFSALLRQSRDTPRHEKLAYVDTIIDLLELQDLADTLIGQVGAGLSVEQRKRVTIGVELVSKPSLLIFLDEPTSGLDGQSAYHTVRFLRKLAATGQPVLATIHQPSAQLFAQFDRLLLLAKGGRTVYFGDIGEQASVVRQYFAKHGAPCPTDANPAEHMIDVVSGTLSQGRNWNEVWLSSPEHAAMIQELETIIDEAASKPSGVRDDGNEFATSLWQQCRLVTQRMNVSLYRNTDYVNNKLALHVFSSMFNGFSFWMTGDSVGDLQLKLFAIFNFVFVAPGVLAQLQPVFLQRRDIFETREKKSKMYSWVAFVTALIVSEIPYLVICAVIYFGCWYYTVGFGMNSARAGGTFYVMLAYEFLYTGIGQFIAAYAPNEMFAALANPLVLGILVSFCGVLVPYAQIPTFWRYWLYYLNPFSYLMGSLLTFNLWGTEIKCRENELAVFGPPNGTTCGDYLAPFLSHAPGAATHLINPQATADCKVCTFARGEDYLFTLNLKKYQDAWEHAGIVTLMVFSSYALVYALMKLRTKTSKKAE